MESKVESVIKQAVEELNQQQEIEHRLVYNPDARLIGTHAEIDSMEFVTLITIIEELIGDEFDRDIRIVSDKAFSRERSPFYSFSSLKDYIIELLEAEG